MESVRIQQGEIERFEVYFVTTASVPLSGITPTITVRRQSDRAYWTGGQDFTSAFSQVSMSAVNPVAQGGYYERTFDTTGLPDAVYSIIASGTGAANSPQTGELKVGFWVDNINQSISSVGGVGGGIIQLEGLLSQKDKDEIIDLIKDSFKDLMDKIENQLEVLSNFKLQFESSNIDFEPMVNRLKNIKDDLYSVQRAINQESELKQLMRSVNV